MGHQSKESQLSLSSAKLETRAYKIVMNKIVILSLVLVSINTLTQSQNSLSNHEFLNEVNHVQVGVCFQNHFKKFVTLPLLRLFEVFIH